MLIALYIVAKLAFQQEKIKCSWQRLLGKIPIVGYLLINANAVRFSRTFALLHESGTPVLVALTNTANALNYLPMQQSILIATEKVREGSTTFNSLTISKCLTINIIKVSLPVFKDKTQLNNKNPLSRLELNIQK